VRAIGGYFFGSRKLGEKVRVQAGARYDWQNTDTEAEILPNNAVAKPALDRYYQSLSGSAGFTYQITKDLFMRSNLASGYRVPSIAELTENGLHGARFEQGNPDLSPMRNYELDLSAHWHSEKVMLELAGYYNSVEQFIYLQQTGDTLSGAPAYEYRQNDAELFGGEAKMSWKISQIFTANVSYASVRGLLSQERNLPFIPQDKIRGNLDFQKKLESRFVKDVSAEIRYTYAFRQDRPGKFEMTTNSYQLLDIALKSRFHLGSQVLEAGVNISNLLNETYIDHLSTLKGIDENILNSGQGRYNPGRNIMIFVNIPFESN
jgi:iron complex outermembrane receptor protein